MESRRIYCLVPSELAGRLHEVLRGHFRDQPEIEVVVEQRRRERRSGAERRASRDAEAPPPEPERRQVRNPRGRRIADRRATSSTLSPEAIPELPRRARRYAEQLTFVERLAPPTIEEEDVDTGRLVTRIQAGEEKLFAELYLRYFDRIYAYLRVALKDPHEAEDVAQQVFIDALEGVSRYEQRGQPFRAWLFTIARYRGIDRLRRGNRLQVTEPDLLDSQQEDESVEGNGLDVLSWVMDQDLQVLIERLPQSQRQVLMLVEVFGMPTREVAEILGRSENDVRALKSRALRFLRRRLTALGRVPRRHERRAGSWVLVRQQRVARRRRFALLGR